jgi:hypothetical protein
MRGIVASKSTQVPHIAAKVPDGTTTDSRVKRIARWLSNEYVTEETCFLPYAEVLLAHLALQTLGLVLDGRVVGRGWGALRLHVVYKGRALPLAWLVRQGKTGPCPADRQLAVVEQVYALLPEGAQVVLLGEGECDGGDLQHPLAEAGWSYVCRTGMHMTALWDGEPFRLAPLGWYIKPGRLLELQAVCCTSDADGPILLICCWAKG